MRFKLDEDQQKLLKDIAKSNENLFHLYVHGFLNPYTTEAGSLPDFNGVSLNKSIADSLTKTANEVFGLDITLKASDVPRYFGLALSLRTNEMLDGTFRLKTTALLGSHLKGSNDRLEVRFKLANNARLERNPLFHLMLFGKANYYKDILKVDSVIQVLKKDFEEVTIEEVLNVLPR